MTATYKSVDGLHRCSWCAATEQYQHYHDEEWGYPVVDDRRLFEKLCLESFQSGLSWRTILEKRDHFRQAFKQFDFRLMAQFNEDDVNRLLNDAGIVRHRGKIEAVINNARCAIKLCKESGSLAHFFGSLHPTIRIRFTLNQSPPRQNPLPSPKHLKNEDGNLLAQRRSILLCRLWAW
jgi:DNA-3-methyladenine glycosylase I